MADGRRALRVIGKESDPGSSNEQERQEMPKLHVVITDISFPDADVENGVLSPLNAEVTLAHCRTEEDVIAVARDADALMVQWAPLTRHVIGQLSRCRIISRYGVGVDMIDLDAARERGIPVMNVPDYCVEEVAAHTLCFLLALGRKVFLFDRSMRQGAWKVDNAIRSINRFGKQTLGVIGLGRIGKRFAQLATPLGMRTLAFDIQPPEDHAPATLTDFETVVSQSDYLSLHCPLTQGTHHLIDAKVLGKMKSGAFLINVSRGGVVDTNALVEALSRNQIAGAALDVYEEEPLPPTHPLIKMNNVILTPHVASYSADAVMQLRSDTARNVLEFFSKR